MDAEVEDLDGTTVALNSERAPATGPTRPERTPTISDGFPGQRMRVLAPGRVEEALEHPVTSHLVVTDVGYFPRAQHHGYRRDRPVDQTVVLVCGAGRGSCRTSTGLWSVEAGDVVVLRGGEPHSYRADVRDPWTLWWMHLDGPAASGFTAALTAHAPVRRLVDARRAIDLVDEALRWTEHDETISSLVAAAGAAWHLLALIVAGRVPGTGLDAVDDAAAYVRENYAKPIDVALLAARANLSPSHFGSTFSRRMGVPVGRYQTQLRMSRARELLDTTTMPVTAVARTVGYVDTFYFSRIFRKIHGRTPSDYRSRVH